MSIETLTKYDYGTNGYIPIPGTEDWVEVGELGTGGGYDWCDFNVYYSPSARRYFWHGASGCSCNSWADDLSGATDFQDGDKDALLRAWQSFAEENNYSIYVGDYASGVATIRGFRPEKA